MSFTRRTAFLLAMLCAAAARFASGQGYAPEEAASHMKLAKGLEARLVAAEPMITQPVAIDFDDRGRLWVMQYLQYPNPAGLKRATVDRWSRTTYDRVPEPPPRGSKGADRLTILEDTNHDGRANAAHDFVNGLNLASGFAFGHGGVFVLNVPYLLFYSDTNHDDVPDGDPVVCLTGFGMEDAHSVANSLTWGPDGWLYGCQGSTVTAHIRGNEFQQGIWRYHPLTHEFELFCEGGGNTWGLDFDDEGELIFSTNAGPYRNLHGVQGGYYWKSFGKHGALHNPYAFGYYEHVPHTNFTGGHVTDGGIIYQGTNLPPQFQGRYICNDLLGHGVQFEQMYRWGSSFSSAYGGYLLEANDKWFAPSDLTMGPDGALYVADWCDKRTAHPDPDADWDRSNGRVYRIAAYGTTPVEVADLTKISTAKLIEVLSSPREIVPHGKVATKQDVISRGEPNDWFVRKARRILAERRDPTAIAPLRRLVFEGHNEHTALEALWALYVSGGFDAAVSKQALEHRNPAIRKWAVRFIGDAKKCDQKLGRKLAGMAATDPDVAVRLQLACSAKRLPAPVALPILEALARRDVDNCDPYIPLMLWWAAERHSSTSMDKLKDFFASADAWKSRLARETILPRLMRRWVAESTNPGYDAAAALLASAPNPAEQQKLVAALAQGLMDSASLPTGFGSGGLFAHAEAVTASAEPSRTPLRKISPALVRQINLLWTADTTSAALISVTVRTRDARGLTRVRELLRQSELQPELRIQLIQLLADFGELRDSALLLSLVDAGPDAVRNAVIEAAAKFDPVHGIEPLLKKYSQLPRAPQARLRQIFLSRKPSARLLLAAVEAGTIPATDFTTEELKVVAFHEDAELNEMVHKHWGRISRGTPEEKLAEMRHLNNELNSGRGNAERGHELFRQTCSVCHALFGEGRSVGPDLTHANRSDREFLLASIVDPSAAIRKEFAAYDVQLKDGRQLSGVIVEQSAGAIILANSTEDRIVLRQSEIESLRESAVSLMPEGLLRSMNGEDVRDLFSYLQLDKPLAKK